ncbi:MAG: HAMP domain-containing protein [Cytophagia bacterium]|nr:HAMP domain-containing protein [Cytophagia bacterium]
MENQESKKKGIRIGIGQKILGGFIILILLFVINAVVIFSVGNIINGVAKKSADTYRPSKDALNEFILTVTKAKMLVTNWVYLQTNQDDKQALRQLQDFDYPALKDKIQKLMVNWESDSQRMMMDTIFHEFDTLLSIQKETIMANLQTFENYEDMLTKLLAEDAIESQVIPRTNNIIGMLNKVAAQQTAISNAADDEVISSVENLTSVTILLAIVMVVLGLVSAFLLMRNITVPINFLKNVVVKLGRGELVEDKQTKVSNDEIGEMSRAMDNLVAGLRATTTFAENIGNGNYKSDFTPLSEHDVLGNALINMRDNLEKVAEDDKKRNWATEGLAKFGELLRTNNNDVQKLSEEIIANMVKYIKGNQGAIYIIDDEETDGEQTMSMKACYAWDKKKYLNQKIFKGEGLAGQAWQEGDSIYLTDVPQNYIRITSGLGDANPSSVLITPLKLNDQVFGVVEVASFNVFQDFEIDFVKKMAESIASTISSVKVNARTQRLLEESQEMTEQMRAQEEEMRQNMEELQATQEEMARKEKDMLKQLSELQAQVRG